MSRVAWIVILWTVLVASAVALAIGWLIVRYGNDPSCPQLSSDCAFEVPNYQKFLLFGVPLIWLGGVLLINVVAFIRRRRA